MNDNGNDPAAPVNVPDEYADSGQYVGLTKRERTAMAAMQGLLSSGLLSVKDHEELSRLAVTHADRLLAELERKI